jgi:hypothetical protein
MQNAGNGSGGDQKAGLSGWGRDYRVFPPTCRGQREWPQLPLKFGLPRRLPATLEHGWNRTSCARPLWDLPGRVTIVAGNWSGRGSRPPVGGHRSRQWAGWRRRWFSERRGVTGRAERGRYSAMIRPACSPRYHFTASARRFGNSDGRRHLDLQDQRFLAFVEPQRSRCRSLFQPDKRHLVIAELNDIDDSWIGHKGAADRAPCDHELAASSNDPQFRGDIGKCGNLRGECPDLCLSGRGIHGRRRGNEFVTFGARRTRGQTHPDEQEQTTAGI